MLNTCIEIVAAWIREQYNMCVVSLRYHDWIFLEIELILLFLTTLHSTYITITIQLIKKKGNSGF